MYIYTSAETVKRALLRSNHFLFAYHSIIWSVNVEHGLEFIDQSCRQAVIQRFYNFCSNSQHVHSRRRASSGVALMASHTGHCDLQNYFNKDFMSLLAERRKKKKMVVNELSLINLVIWDFIFIYFFRNPSKKKKRAFEK